MKLPWHAAPIRVRLTGWYAVALAAMMIVYATVTYVAVRHEFLEQLDDQLHDDFETARRLLLQTSDGRIVIANVWRHHGADGDDARVYEVWSPIGAQLDRSGASVLLPPIARAASASTSYRYETVAANKGQWRTLTAPVQLGNEAVVLRVSRSEERVRHQLWEILVVLVLGLPLVVTLAGVGGYMLARRALAPIDRLASEARRITAERLHQRLTVPNRDDEIGRLTRQSYVMAVVKPAERTFASGVTNVTRHFAWAVGPALAGAVMQHVALAGPLVIGGVLKIAYDLMLFASFRHVRPPEKQVAPALATSASGGPTIDQIGAVHEYPNARHRHDAARRRIAGGRELR